MSAVAAILLAAGNSRRFGPDNKLLAPYRGRPLAAHALAAARGSRADPPIVVVTGCEAARVAAALKADGVRLVHNPDYETGMASSLKAGLAALPEATAGAMILLADMPDVTAAVLDALIAGFEEADLRAIVAPRAQGRLGNPVVWPRRFFSDMMALSGDQGARRLIEAHRGDLVEVAIDDAAVLRDVDRPEALEEGA